MPASVTIDIPVMVELNGLLDIKSPSKTPTNDINTAERISNDW